MNNNSLTTPTTFFERILQKTGGWYLLLAVFATQLIAGLATITAEHAVQINADFTQYQLASLFKFAAIVLAGTNFVLLLIVHFAYAETRRGLQRWKENPSHNSEEHLVTWKQITSFAWRYSVMVFLAGILLSINTFAKIV